MKTEENPALDFWSKFLDFLEERRSDHDLAEQLIDIKRRHPDNISIEVDLDMLDESVMKCEDHPGDRVEMMEDLAVHCFRDLAPQMYKKAARLLFRRLCDSEETLRDDLFMHIKSKKEIGDDMVAVTIIASNDSLFKYFWSDSENSTELGQVHTTDRQD